MSGKVALVTGAARGIGAAVCRRLTGLGAAVAAVDLDQPVAAVDLDQPAAAVDLDQPVEAGESTPAVARPDGIWYRADVTDPSGVDAAVEAVERELGPIDICVSVAGVLRTGPVVAATDADWAAVFAVNATGVFHVSRAAARRMVPRRRGAIVTVASNAAGVPRSGMAAYAASKAAAAMFTKCLGLELAPYGIRCNVVAPGSTDTDMQRRLWDAGGGPEGVIAGDPAAYRVGIPLGRIADPADIADAVAFLVSDRARHITMHDLYVDGGATLRA